MRHRPPHDAFSDPEQATLRNALQRLIADGGIHDVIHVDGTADPPQDATVSGSPRLVITLSGENVMLLPIATDDGTGSGIEERTLRGRQAVFITQRSWNLVLRQAPFEFITLDYKSDYVRYYWRKHFSAGSRSGQTHMYIRPGSASAVVGHLLRALDALGESRQGFGDHCGLSQALLHQSMLDIGDERHTASKAQVSYQYLVDYIEDHLNGDLSRQAVAEACGLHPNHVSRLFRECGQESFNGFVTRMRMTLAASLLERYNSTIKAVAQRVGYDDVSYFGVNFRKQFGLSPGQYRQSHHV